MLESVRAFGVYAERGVGAPSHAEPWYYYLRLLAWSSSGGLRWSEGLILVLAVAGAVSVFHSSRHPAHDAGQDGGRSLPHPALRTSHPARRTSHPALRTFWPLYLTLYSLLTCAIFSAIPYKTPWNLLPFYVGVVLMAGFGCASLVHIARPRAVRALLVVALLAATVQLGAQDWRANFRYGADERNPYAYVHTSPDLLRLVGRIRDLSAVHPDGPSLFVKVVAGPHEQWPLPWYLRGMKRVGYWTSAGAARSSGDAPVIVASSENSGALDALLGDRYVAEYYGLRPGVLLTLYIERSLWDRFLASRAPAGK
jgi:predicted membrane-bound mannosyltransferase